MTNQTQSLLIALDNVQKLVDSSNLSVHQWMSITEAIRKEKDKAINDEIEQEASYYRASMDYQAELDNMPF